MNPNTLDQQMAGLLEAAQRGDAAVLRSLLQKLDLTSQDEAIARIKNLEIQLRFGYFFQGKRTTLDEMYVGRPSSSDATATEAYTEIITTYLSTFDSELKTLEESLEKISVAETLATKADDAAVQQHIVQALTQDNQHDQAWFVSRAHMTRDGVNESLWSIVTASEDDPEMFVPVLDGAFTAANRELTMAVNGLIPQSNATEVQS